VQAAAARGGGRLEALDVSRCLHVNFSVLRDVLRAARHAGALRELRAGCGLLPGCAPLSYKSLNTLLRAAPQLTLLSADTTFCDAADAARLLRNEGVFAPLRLTLLRVNAPATLPDLHALLADIAAHASLTGLALYHMPHGDGGLDAVVDVALARAFTAFSLIFVRLNATPVPPLVRLLRDGALRTLHLDCHRLDAPAVAVVACALGASTTLTRVTLLALRRDEAATAALLGALTGHAHVRCVWLLDVRALPSHAAARRAGRPARRAGRAAARQRGGAAGGGAVRLPVRRAGLVPAGGRAALKHAPACAHPASAPRGAQRLTSLPARPPADGGARQRQPLRALHADGADEAEAHVRSRRAAT
jgi:hypothetical protein